MDKRKQKMFLIVGTLMLFACAPAKATNPDSVLTAEVFSRLIAICEKPENLHWPPVLTYEESSDINAFAFLNKTQPFVVVHSALVKELLNSDADRLAFVIGHELAHVTLGHVKTGHSDTKFKTVIFSREDEIAADMKGMQYAIKAGYSYKTALKGIQNAIKLGMEYSSYEGLGADHPSWKERLTYLDKEQAQLWKSMAAFENGNLFLAFEQYLPAERCFRSVTQEFPSCYEAWANLGYAMLMRYCDALDTKDIQEFGIGHIVTGGFYRRVETLEQLIRGVDEDLWWDAVGALREALRLKPKSVIARANLGIAYLVRPNGKDVGEALKFLLPAAEEAEKDTTLDTRTRMAILLNAGVVEMSGTTAANAGQFFKRAEDLGRSFAGKGVPVKVPSSMIGAIAFNKAQLFARDGADGKRAEAITLLEAYLTRMSPSSLWWPIAYDQYAELCRKEGLKPKIEPAGQTDAGRRKRIVVSLEIDEKIHVTLGEDEKNVKERLGTPLIIPIAGRTNLLRQRFQSRDLELLTSDKVLAIFLTGEKAPSIPLRVFGIGTTASALRIGMTKDEVDKELENYDFSFGEFFDTEKFYRFYRDLGIALLIRKDKVAELAIAVLPQ